MSKVLLCFLFCCCLVLRSVYGNTSPSIAPTESSIDIPTFAPRLTRRTIPTGQPYALQSLSTPSVPSIASSEPPSCTPSTSFEIPSPTPPFSSTAQPTTDQLIPSAEPGTFKSMSSNLPSSSPDRPTLRPDCFSASVVRASQVS